METCTFGDHLFKIQIWHFVIQHTLLLKSQDQTLQLGEWLPNPPLANKILIVLGFQTKGVDWLI